MKSILIIGKITKENKKAEIKPEINELMLFANLVHKNKQKRSLK